MPRHIRGLVMLAIRTAQFITQPLKSALKMAMRKSQELEEERTRWKEMAGPTIR